MLRQLVQTIPRRTKLGRQQIRSFSSTLPILEQDAEAAKQEYSFSHPRAEEMYNKMTKLSLEEIQTLTELINQRLGITISEAEKEAIRRGGVMGGGGGGGEAEAAEEVVEKTAFDLKLTGFDAKGKIKVIKEIRAITGLGLKEAKAMVEEAPKTVKSDIKMEEAEELKAKLEAVGATVEIA